MAEGEPLRLSEENLARHNELLGDIEFRQFTCKRCWRSWWKRVAMRKPVSKCKKCYKKYDALHPNDEFGVAEFVCQCGHTFTSRGRATSACSCYKCGALCKVSRIIPGRKEMRGGGSGNRHSCDSCNGKGNCPNFKPVINFSSLHISTGSTGSSVTAHEYEVELPAFPHLDGIEETEYSNDSGSECVGVADEGEEGVADEGEEEGEGSDDSDEGAGRRRRRGSDDRSSS